MTNPDKPKDAEEPYDEVSEAWLDKLRDNNLKQLLKSRLESKHKKSITLSTSGTNGGFVEQLFRTNCEKDPKFIVADSCPPHLRVDSEFPTDKFIKALSEKITKQLEQIDLDGAPNTIIIDSVVYHRENVLQCKKALEQLQNLSNRLRFISKPHSTNSIFSNEFNRFLSSDFSATLVVNNFHTYTESKKERDNQKKADFKKSPLENIGGKKKTAKLSKFFRKKL